MAPRDRKYSRRQRYVLHHAQLFLPELSAADHRRDPAAAWLPSAAAGERLVSRVLAARRAARGAVPALHRSQRDDLFQRRIRLLRGDGADLCHARGADAALLLLLAGITHNAEKGGDRRGRRPRSRAAHLVCGGPRAGLCPVQRSAARPCDARLLYSHSAQPLPSLP